MRHRDAARRARTSQPDDMLGADVGSENGRSDNPPSEIAPGKEVIGGGLLALADDPPCHAEQDAEVQRDHQPVERGNTRFSHGIRSPPYEYAYTVNDNSTTSHAFLGMLAGYGGHDLPVARRECRCSPQDQNGGASRGL